MSDRFARVVASIALALAFVAVVLAAYSLRLSAEYKQDVHTLGETLRTLVRPSSQDQGHLPLRSPPPQLDPDTQ